MKKQLLTLISLAVPSTAFCQAYETSSTGYGSLVAGIIVILFALLIFLVLRQVMLWYWKVDTIIKNQETTNNLLKNNNDLLNEYIVYMKTEKGPIQPPK